jgi:molybdate transport system substrate-binding protein
LRCKVLVPVMMLALIAIRAHGTELRVAAAANVQKVLTEAILPAFEKQSGIHVVASYGSTKVLATQIENGAPFDVFLSADTATVDKLAASGDIVKGSARVYAIGRLVIWSRNDLPHKLLRIEGLGDPMFKTIAVANPKLAPYGQAAMEAVDHVHLTYSVSPRIVYAENVAQALQYARSGNADVAFTALSLVLDDKDNPYIVVPDEMHKPLRQAAGVVSSATDRAAAAQFVDFLTSPAIQAVWEKYGYAAPGAKKPGQPKRAKPAVVAHHARPMSAATSRSRAHGRVADATHRRNVSAAAHRRNASAARHGRDGVRRAR